jgi:predicted nucleic acid-binding protein
VVPLDASVLIELVVAGRHHQAADALLARYAIAEPRLVLASAAHALVEAASALRRLVRLGNLDPPSGAEAIDWLSRLDLALEPTSPWLGRIWSLREVMSAYDAAYAAMAEAIGGPLVTVDRRLLIACRRARIAAIHLDDFAAYTTESHAWTGPLSR